MKKLITIILMLVFVGVAIAAPVRIYFTNKADVEFAWDYDFVTEPDVAGFNLYVGTQVTKVEGQVKSYIYKSYPLGTTIVTVTAYDKYGNESDKSEEIQVNKKTIKPNKATTFRVSNPSFTIVVGP